MAKPKIAVCHAGVGNVRSVVRAVSEAARAAEVVETRDPVELRSADVVVVPGQGSFGAFARAMAAGLGDALTARLREGRPYLGICLGMQVLFETSEEAEGARGLGLFRGRVRRLAPGVDEATGRARPLPHIGWNTAVPTESGARSAIGDEPEHFYFAHSYAVEPADASLVAATTEYGERFASAISAPKLLGVQFHPEKSQRAGVALLRRFFESLGH